MRTNADKYLGLRTRGRWPTIRAGLLALLLYGPVPGIGDTAAANTTAPEDVGDITRIVDHLSTTDLLDRLADNPDGVSIRIPDSRRVYTVKLVGDNLLIRTDSGQTYKFLLKSLL